MRMIVCLDSIVDTLHYNLAFPCLVHSDVQPTYSSWVAGGEAIRRNTTTQDSMWRGSATGLLRAKSPRNDVRPAELGVCFDPTYATESFQRFGDSSRFDLMQLASAVGRRMREGLQRIAHKTGLCRDCALATKSPTPIPGTGIGGSPKLY
jgi:hypothetical protein